MTVPDLSYFLWGPFFEQGPAMGLILNIVMSLAALLSGILLGIPVGLLRVIAPIWLKAPVTLLVTLIRSTPLLLLVLWLFLLIQNLSHSEDRQTRSHIENNERRLVRCV